jgi:hypothetical protein
MGLNVVDKGGFGFGGLRDVGEVGMSGWVKRANELRQQTVDEFCCAVLWQCWRSEQTHT